MAHTTFLHFEIKSHSGEEYRPHTHRRTTILWYIYIVYIYSMCHHFTPIFHAFQVCTVQEWDTEILHTSCQPLKSVACITHHWKHVDIREHIQTVAQGSCNDALTTEAIATIDRYSFSGTFVAPNCCVWPLPVVSAPYLLW